MKKENAMQGNFAYVAITDGFEHPQGVALTKKDAKHKAASIAFCALNELIPKQGDRPVAVKPESYRHGTTISDGDDMFQRQKVSFQNHIGAETASFVSTATGTSSFPQNSVPQGLCPYSLTDTS